ncbi:LTXXQ motif protein [mine drainage metagenome]|uniref:LTXXQ motif protein n=1 Tax=mine drainage metagenome TaxID=410659 RepID=A0A1J5TDG8_9ZZZZ
MNSYFRIGLAALVFSAVASFAAASVAHHKHDVQHGPHFREFQAARMHVIADKLGLSADQRAKLKDIRKQTAATVQAVRANTALKPEQKRQQIAAVWRSSRVQMKSVLTDAQKGRLAQILSHPRRLNRMAAMRVRVIGMENRLGLSPDQRGRIQAIAHQTASALKPLRTDKTLAADARRAKIRELRQDEHKQILAVLTPEQTKQLGRMRHRMLAPLGPLG